MSEHKTDIHALSIDSITLNLYILFDIRNDVTVSYYDDAIFNAFKALTESQFTKLNSFEENAIPSNKTVFLRTKLFLSTKHYSFSVSQQKLYKN